MPPTQPVKGTFSNNTKNLFPASVDVVEFCRDGLDLPEWSFSSIQSSLAIQPSLPNLSIKKEKNSGGWRRVVWDSPYLLPNIDWRKIFWKPTNSSKTIYILAIRKDDYSHKIATF